MCIALPAIFLMAVLLLREFPIGADFYAYLNPENLPQNTPMGAIFMFQLLGSSILMRYVAFLLLLSAFLYFTYLLALSYCTKYAWLAPLFAFLTPIAFLKFIEIENETFGYVFLPLLYLLLLRGGLKNNLLCFTLTIGSAFLFWHGNIFFLLAFIPSISIFAIASALILTYFWEPILAALKPLENVGESVSILGIGHLFFLLFGFLGLPKKALIPSLIFLILTFINARFAIFLVPLLAVGLICFIEKCEEKRTKLDVGAFFVVFAVMTIAYTAVFLIPQFPPDASQASAVKFAVKEAKGNEMAVDWSLCHFSKYMDAKTECEQAPSPLKIREITLTEKKLKAPCTKLKSFGAYVVYRCSKK